MSRPPLKRPADNDGEGERRQLQRREDAQGALVRAEVGEHKTKELTVEELASLFESMPADLQGLTSSFLVETGHVPSRTNALVRATDVVTRGLGHLEEGTFLHRKITLERDFALVYKGLTAFYKGVLTGVNLPIIRDRRATQGPYSHTAMAQWDAEMVNRDRAWSKFLADQLGWDAEEQGRRVALFRAYVDTAVNATSWTREGQSQDTWVGRLEWLHLGKESSALQAILNIAHRGTRCLGMYEYFRLALVMAYGRAGIAALYWVNAIAGVLDAKTNMSSTPSPNDAIQRPTGVFKHSFFEETERARYLLELVLAAMPQETEPRVVRGPVDAEFLRVWFDTAFRSARITQGVNNERWVLQDWQNALRQQGLV